MSMVQQNCGVQPRGKTTITHNLIEFNSKFAKEEKIPSVKSVRGIASSTSYPPQNQKHRHHHCQTIPSTQSQLGLPNSVNTPVLVTDGFVEPTVTEIPLDQVHKLSLSQQEQQHKHYEGLCSCEGED